MTQTVTISKSKYSQMKREIKTLRNKRLYKKVLKANRDLNQKMYTRDEIGL